MWSAPFVVRRRGRIRYLAAPCRVARIRETCALGDTNGDGKPDVAVHLPAMEEVRILSGADYSTLVTVSLTPLLKHNRR